MGNSTFPEELLMEIFSRLPAKSIGRFRCLSKLWRTNLSTPQFVISHLNRPVDATILRTRLNRNIYTIRNPIDANDTVDAPRLLDVLGECYHIIGACNGFVLVDRNSTDFVVLNPLTLQHVIIKKPALTGTVTYGFGYNSSSDDYKIVKVSTGDFDPNGRSRKLVDVYSMRTGTWKRLENYPYYHVPNSRHHGVFLNGAIHWLTDDLVSDPPRYAEDVERRWYEAVARDPIWRPLIAAFDVATETFHEINVPNAFPGFLISYELYAIGGWLVMANNIYLQIMKEYGQVNSWTKFSVFQSNGRPLKPLFFIGENEVVSLADGGLNVINLKEGTTKEFTVPVHGHHETIVNGVAFVESLVSPIQYDATGVVLQNSETEQ